jgi:PAS domain-containing protein
VLAVMLFSLRAEALRSGERVIESLAQVIAEQTARTFQSIDQRLQLSSARVRQPDVCADPGQARDMLRGEIAESPFVRALSVSDARGRILCSTDGEAVGQSVADRSYFQIYLREPRTTFYLGPPVRGRVSGAWMISASRPLISAKGDFAGVMVASVEPPYFERLWNSADLGTGGSIALFRRDGMLMLRAPFDDAVMGKTFPNLSIVSQPLEAKPVGHFIDKSVFDGTVRLFGYRVLPGRPDLVVVIGQAYDLVMAPWRQLATIALSIWAMASLVILALAGFLNRAWTERITGAESAQLMTERLALATEAASIGVWDWDLKADRWYATPT